MKSNQSPLTGGAGGIGGAGGAGGVSGGVAASPPPGADARAEGLGRSGLGSAGGQRLPVAPRERKPALAALAVLLILGGALASAYLVMASGERVAAIRIAQPVAAGEPIPASALEPIQVSEAGTHYFLYWSERQKVAGSYAAVPLVKGALLTNGMLSQEAARGRIKVGLALKPGQYPSRDLVSGSRVAVYAVGTGDGGPAPGTVLASDAVVTSVSEGGDDERLRGGLLNVDIAVAPAQAPQVAQAAAEGAVAIALVPEGTKVPAGPPPATGNQTPAGGPGPGSTPSGTGPSGTGGN